MDRVSGYAKVRQLCCDGLGAVAEKLDWNASPFGDPVQDIVRLSQ